MADTSRHTWPFHTSSPRNAPAAVLTDVLRHEWGFKGFVVTDYTSINEMVPHGYARDEAEREVDGFLRRHESAV